MPVYKDNTKKGSWFVTCYYTDYLGHRKQKLKRGFKTKKDGQAWERDFLERQSGQPTMLFKNLAELYFDDYKTRYKLRSYETKKDRVELHILPYFKNIPINKISPNMVRAWQNQLKTLNGGEFAINTKNSIFFTLSGIMAYACKYHNLNSNPCSVVGSFKGPKQSEKAFLTLEQYKAFRASIKDIMDLLIFDLLFYTGIRKGELLALTFSDIDTDKKILHITKTIDYHKTAKNVSTPKTQTSIRDIALPDFLISEFKEYSNRCYDTSSGTRVIQISVSDLKYKKDKYLKLAGLPYIRIHDFRHSHAALLVELGENPLLIAARLGHADIKMTLNTYAHLYPNKQKELAGKLNDL